jgi:ubiquinone/menaquinone biosynthesis C-methylase UbiE
MTALPNDKRDDRDIFRLAPTLDITTIQTIANRLEFRGIDHGYTQISQAYFDLLPLSSARRILALGCGTGVEVRALKRRLGMTAEIVGIDHSSVLIEVAERLTREEGVEGVRYEIGDAHSLTFDDASFDIVLLHTLVSHVDSPLQVFREARRVVKSGGTVAVFDGDYASLTFAYPDPLRAKQIEEMLLRVVVANPRVMRDLPRLFREVGLELVSGTGTVYAETGSSGFWANFAQSYGAVLAQSALLPRTVVEDWVRYQAQAVQENIFFGASNYYTYLAHAPQ